MARQCKKYIPAKNILSSSKNKKAELKLGLLFVAYSHFGKLNQHLGHFYH